MYIVKRNSWHYRFNNELKSRYKSMPQDFCSYWSMTLWNIFKFLVLSVPIVSFLSVIGYNLYQDPISWLIAFGTVIGLIATALILAWIAVDGIPTFITWCINRNGKIDSEPQPGLIRMKYRSWKERHCSPLKYED